MIYCFPTVSSNGLKAEISGHFGSAPFFTCVHEDGTGLEVIDNGGLGHEHGRCNPVAALEGSKVDAVVCGGMGLRALGRFNESGIKVLRTAASTVEEALGEIRAGQAEEMTADGACSHHGGCRG
jgi:predicted Fe-Mo cluster-binding NifX family protein